MYWTNGKKCFQRVDRKCLLRTNGDFVDFHFEKNGKRMWFSISKSDLREILSKETGNSEYCLESIIRFDEKMKLDKKKKMWYNG